MSPLVHKRLSALLLPMLWPGIGLMLAAAWLGYSLAQYMAQQPSAAATWNGMLMAVGPALLALLVLGAMAYWAVRKALGPWVHLAQSLQLRAPKDLRPLQLAPGASLEVQAMTEALNRLFARASAESDAQQRFIADAAHQLRTPLAALQSQVEAWALMAQAAPDKSIVLPCAQVERLRQACRRTTQLANQLLVLSRVDRSWGETSLAIERVDIKSLCEELFESFLDTALAKNLDLGLEAHAAHVSGQAWLLREMLTNILDNAIKYTPDGGQITLRCGRRASEDGSLRVFIEVEDNGVGVHQSEYARLTQRFYRVPGVAADGSGLGLAIVQEIAQAHAAQLVFGLASVGQGLCVALIFEE